MVMLNWFDCVTLCSDPPPWKRLISYTLPTHERISLITSIFSDRGEVEAVGQLSGDDAQTFIDIINEVGVCTLLAPKNGQVTPTETPALLVRYWIASHNRSTGGVCALYTGSVVVKSYFQKPWWSHSVMTQQGTHSVVVGLQMCGRANIMARILQPRP